jgi:hypothetical protein
VISTGALFGYRVQSELPLPRLRPERDEYRGTIEIRRADGDLGRGDAHEVGRLTFPDGAPLFTLFEADDALFVECALSGRFRLEPELRSIATDAREATPFWQDRILNAIVPLLLGCGGDLMLHAAAVTDGEQALLVTGASRQGKSTLAAALARQGAEVLAEDGVALARDGERTLAWPGPWGVRLRPPDSDPRAPKLLHGRAADGTRTDPVEVGALAVLAPRGGQGVELREVDSAEALPATFRNLFVGRRNQRQEAFSAAADLVRRTPVYELRLPDDLDAVDAAAEYIWRRLGRSAIPV